MYFWHKLNYKMDYSNYLNIRLLYHLNYCFGICFSSTRYMLCLSGFYFMCCAYSKGYQKQLKTCEEKEKRYREKKTLVKLQSCNVDSSKFNNEEVQHPCFHDMNKSLQLLIQMDLINKRGK